jgi:hypothetical protein
MDEPDLLRCVSEMTRCVAAQDWRGLAALYDPRYRGRRGSVRNLSAEEEILRLREEVSVAGLTLKEYKLTTAPPFVSASVARLTVAERLELAWPDGCRRVVSRQFVQWWHRSDDGWRLRRAEALPGSEYIEEQAPLLPDIQEMLREAESCLQPGGAVPFVPDFLPALGAWFCQQIVLPPRLSVAVETRGVPICAAEALRRACRAALEAWNQSLHDIVELVEHESCPRPDILIRACDRPIFGTALGFYLSGSVTRSTQRRAHRAELRIAVFERSGRTALCLSPPELFAIVCHELGHCFGLGECTHEGRVMAALDWMAPAPWPPFLAERQAILRWLELAQNLLASASLRLGREGEAEAASERAAALRSAAGSKLALLPSPAFELLAEISYAPAVLQQFWEGSAEVRQCRFDRALAGFDQALDEAERPELLLRRAPTQQSATSRLADLRRAVDLAPDWLYAHQCLLAWLEHQGPRHEAKLESQRGQRLRWREEIEYQLLMASFARSPWAVTAALVRAGVRSVRVFGANHGDRLGRR